MKNNKQKNEMKKKDGRWRKGRTGKKSRST